MPTPTREQQPFVDHDIRKHAALPSVPGAGKTISLAMLVERMLKEGASARSMRVLMFNRKTREQFKARLESMGIPKAHQPKIDNFHSFAKKLVEHVEGIRLVPMSEGREWYLANKTISNLERRKVIPAGVMDPSMLLEAIGQWKSLLVPPDRAGHKWNRHLVEGYREFELLRQNERCTQFADWIAWAVKILERGVKTGTEFLIIDEAQDMSYSYMRLVQLLANGRATVIMSGDDMQTLYEWNGARAAYLQSAADVLGYKPMNEYRITRSFRFGPVIAQAADNVMSHSRNKIESRLIAMDPKKKGFVQVIEDRHPGDSDEELAKEMLRLVRSGVHPSEIRVLSRTFSQMDGLESYLLRHRVPYRVAGRDPFFKRKENVVLLNYVKLAGLLDSEVSLDLLLSVMNAPSRFIPHDAVKAEARSSTTNGEVLERLSTRGDLSNQQRYRVWELLSLLRQIDPSKPAGDVLSMIVSRTGYLAHFVAYYGDGSEALDRQRSAARFVGYAYSQGASAAEFAGHVEGLDTQRGAPKEQAVVLTTAYREKGCEYDYVFIPRANEGSMPCLVEQGDPVYDTGGVSVNLPQSPLIENERRLFYVAITRARVGVYIGCASGKGEEVPSRFIDEMQLEHTTPVMSALQQFAERQTDAARSILLNRVAEHGGVKRIAQNLLSEYLPELDEQLCASAAEVIEGLAEIPFGYRFSHERAPSDLPQPLHSSWSQVVGL